MFGQIEIVRTALFHEAVWSAVAVASSGDVMYVAWAARDAEIRLASSRDGFTFSTPVHLPFKSEGVVETSSRKSKTGRGSGSLRPGLAVSANGPDLAVRPYDRRIRILRSTQSRHWHEIETGQRSPVSPSLAPLGDEVVLTWIGSDHRLNLALTVKALLGPARRLDHTSMATPAVSTFGSKVVLAWTGRDLHVNLVTGDIHGTLSPNRRLDETSEEGPAVCAGANAIAIAWVGTDNHVNVTIADNATIRTSLRLDIRTFYEPGLVCLRGDLFLVWTGTRGEVGIAQLRAPDFTG